jgi:hypothetical protein
LSFWCNARGLVLGEVLIVSSCAGRQLRIR